MSSDFPPMALLCQPSFSERPWGGTLLVERLRKPVPPGKTIGEAWELSDHPNGRSTVAMGPLAGKTFGEVLRQYPREMIGREQAPERYPLLVKIIDAGEDLSIQVHPNDEQAARRGDRGKTECWYVMDCRPGTEVIYGVKPGATPEDFRRGAVDGSIEDMVARFPLEPGHFLFVSAGTVHAILGGTLICEIQQSSDTTYRLWDWNRQPAREIHIEESLEVIDWDSAGKEPARVPFLDALAQPLILADNEFFRVRAIDVPAGETVELPRDLVPTGTIIVSVSGSGQIVTPGGDLSLETGATAFLPAICGGHGKLRCSPADAWRVLVAESREV